ncbi:MAG: tRNA preQ1(34) S-adenosylmethionine ribosyltransferase-isomerase QueA [Gemmatimonadaceae bacterium]|nr:tRNA preQ1(34) S-adenosylmethionine ribosyltransferase-isomerase QueA [Gemmatimonadaceae bacterium]
MPRTWTAADFDYELPPALIAQEPLASRDASRLMVLRRREGTIEHRTFRDLPELIASGDVLVRNTSRVFRARLLGTRDSGRPAEVFLLKRRADGTWEALVQPGGKLHPPRIVHVAPGFDVEIVAVTERRTRLVRLRVEGTTEDAAIEQFGHVPLPPYIHRPDASADSARYQTVYADRTGSVAAPTAGLHFTPELLAAIEERGATVADVLLHVGAGTFKPVTTESIAEHRMHEEWFAVPAGTAQSVNDAHRRGSAVWAVGTTTLRTLETLVQPDGGIRAGSGDTSIFIHPPYEVRAADRLVTNFHLPRSTLLMLVSAFAGHGLAMRAYAEAVRERYRFYSYGDAMAII